MSKTNYVFERTEKKYLLSIDQYDRLMKIINPYVKDDEYGSYTICNIYFDTEDYYLIRKSLDKPSYKEKLRIRSYGTVKDGDKVFLEIKKKYDGIVYKRRISISISEAEAFMKGKADITKYGQIGREIDYFMKFYSPKPKMYIAYDRRALAGINDDALRITFDTGIRNRENLLTLRMDEMTKPLFVNGTILMELKCADAMPLWLVSALTQINAYPVSFSKYGSFYKRRIESMANVLEEDRRNKKCLIA